MLIMSYRLPDGICLIPVSSDTNSVSSIISPSEGFRVKDLALGVLKLSLDECTEFIILGFIIMVVQVLCPSTT
jgi:hypothetical protein